MRADTWFQHIYPFTVDLKCCNWISCSGISLCWNQSQSLFLILHCGQSVLFGDLLRACQNRTRMWCFALSTAVKSGGWSWLWRSKERDWWVKEAEIRIEGLTSSETVQTEAVWEIGKETEEWWLIQEKKKKKSKTWSSRREWKPNTKERQRERRLRLRWDWDSAEDWHHHCDSACLGAEPTPPCTTGSIRRDEGKRCVKEHKITVLRGAWKSRGVIK